MFFRSEFFGGGAPNIRQQIGMFTLYPAVGVIGASSCMQVTVDMMGETPGYSEEVRYFLHYCCYMACPCG